MTRQAARDDVFLPCKEDGAHIRGVNADTRLARAVVAQAFIDSFIASDVAIAASEGGKAKTDLRFRGVCADHIRAEARLWLTARSGPWRRAREFTCALADLCPDRTREAALGLLAAIERGEDARKILGRRVDGAAPIAEEFVERLAA